MKIDGELEKTDMDHLIDYAKSWLGVPYIWGGQGRDGIDCCLTGETLIQSSDGFKKIKDFESGDNVVSYKEGKIKKCRVVSVHKNGLKPVFKVRTTASTIRATANHKFLKVMQAPADSVGWSRRKNRRLDWEKVENIKPGDVVVMARKQKKKDDCVPYNDDQIIFFGAMIGDGTITQKGFNLCFVSKKKRELVPEFESYLTNGFGFENTLGNYHESHGLMYHCVKTRKVLIEMGMGEKSCDRKLPHWVFKLSDDRLKLFMYGYLSADGSRFEREKECGYALSSASEVLIKELHALLLSRGYMIQNVKKTERNKPIIIKGIEVKNPKPLWTLSINDNDIKLFPYRNVGPDPYGDFNLSKSFTFHRVCSIVEDGVEETYDLTIADSHSYLAGSFVVHNSGYLQIIGEAAGIDPRGDQTADALYRHFKTRAESLKKPKAGAFVFYGTNERKIHCAFAISENLVIESGGGGSKTNTVEDAHKHKAYVRIRPYNYRPVEEILMPSYKWDKDI